MPHIGLFILADIVVEVLITCMLVIGIILCCMVWQLLLLITYKLKITVIFTTAVNSYDNCKGGIDFEST